MQTININKYEVDGTKKILLSRKVLQEIFKISSRDWWLRRLDACGFDTRWFMDRLGITESEYNPISVTNVPLFQFCDIRKLALLDLFLNAKKGRKGFSIEQFRLLSENNYLDTLETELGLNPDQHFEKLLREYNNGQTIRNKTIF
jgi:hypothetical protein